ncbi:hypothetical protein CEXT_427261 [Caerostris extrusa]|uniref:Secreted protein n=1 Tax=Caerostris extrusa TaxID=172846 RepID=A0AAV4W448_CAEEX|nr:hypothetical protein CEXT_427261 [Caerostris extrusa]
MRHSERTRCPSRATPMQMSCRTMRWAMRFTRLLLSCSWASVVYCGRLTLVSSEPLPVHLTPPQVDFVDSRSSPSIRALSLFAFVWVAVKKKNELVERSFLSVNDIYITGKLTSP